MVDIGIIGYGIVGKAIEMQFKNNRCHILTLDPKLNNGTDYGFINLCEYIFVCVPTPMRIHDGSIDPSIVLDVIKNLNTEAIVVIKSTITPDIMLKIANSSNLNLVMSPEYLTEKNYETDALKLKSLVVGGSDANCEKVISLYTEYSNCIPGYGVGKTDLIGACILKYMENCFLALKVSFMNEMYQVLSLSGSTDNWDNIAKCFHLDSRMGNSHYKVPGPDGDFGWGGKCFPKDINAMISYGKSIGIDIQTVNSALQVNKHIRKNKDWLNIEGAVSN